MLNLSVISSLKMSEFWILLVSHCLILHTKAVGFSGPSLISVAAGERVTLDCPFVRHLEKDHFVIWYKQIFGEMPRNVGQGMPYEDVEITQEFQTSGFKIQETENSISLTIPSVKREHGGLYYCAQLSWDNATLSRGTILSVTDDEDVKVSVFQSGVSDWVPAGASVTLRCSVLSESRPEEIQVFWFRAAPSQCHPQIIYTHHNSRHQCESDSSTHTCVYNMSKNILSLNDTGTYYCAVALCGKIVFGNGTRVQMEDSADPAVSFLAVSLGVCVVVVIVVHVLCCIVRNCEFCSGRSQASMLKRTPNQSGDAVEGIFAASLINKRKGKREGAHDNVYIDVIYSTVS